MPGPPHNYGTNAMCVKFHLRAVYEAYLMKDSGTVIGYRICYRKFSIMIYNLSKDVCLFAVLNK